MRKSFGGSYGGGGGGGGGDMLQTVGKTMRTRLNNFQENLPSNYSPTKKSSSSTKTTTKATTDTSKHALSLSSLTHHSNNGGDYNGSSLIPFFGYRPSYDYYDDEEKSEIESEWECLEDYYDPIFGVVPSTNEVQHALLSLQEVLYPQSSPTSDIDKDVEDEIISSTDEVQRASSKSLSSDWLEPSMQPFDGKLTPSPGWGRVYDAFHLLESEPSVQRMVVSLSSDKAVWDAVLNNETVREIRDSYRNAAEFLPPSSDEKPQVSKRNTNILKWIFENMREKLLEVLGNISQMVADILKPLNYDKGQEYFGFTEKLKTTFLITVVVLLIVVVARGHRT